MELFQEPRPYDIVFEMGRFLTASCGYYMTKIVDQKKNDAVNVCIVDGGINHVNYYGQNMAMKTPILSYFPAAFTGREGSGRGVDRLWFPVYGV